MLDIAIVSQRLLHFAFCVCSIRFHNSRVIACNVMSDLAYGFARTTRAGLEKY